MSELFFQTGLSFDDVLLVPKKSCINSRSEIDISSTINNTSFSLPIISSPMDTVTESQMAATMFDHGGLGIIHRYNTVEEQCNLVRDCLPDRVIAAAVGVTGDFKERACALYDAGVKILCIDVAHGHHTLVERALKSIRDIFGEGISIMAGNVATAEAFTDLETWGADAIRVGVGGGSICSTRIQTGHGIPTFQSIYACSFACRPDGAKLIADGGIKNAGDIVKSIAAGADFVMLGSLLAGSKESPGNVLRGRNGKKYKVYRGMASVEAQEAWRGEARSLEGVSTTIPYKGSVRHILLDLKQNIKSGFSYSGAKNQKDFKEEKTFVRQLNAGITESSTHILNKR